MERKTLFLELFFSVLFFGAVSCNLVYQGQYSCKTDKDCPAGQKCGSNNICYMPDAYVDPGHHEVVDKDIIDSGGSDSNEITDKDTNVRDKTGCQPKTCDELGFECGVAKDGCGRSIYCGKCKIGKTCKNHKCIAKTSVCGDGTCDKDENCSSCPNDCGCDIGEICDHSSGRCIKSDSKKVLWTQSLNEEVFSISAALSKDGQVLYVAGTSTLYAIDINDKGRILWSKKIGNNVTISSSPVVGDYYVYVAADSTIYAINQYNNNLVRSYDCRHGDIVGVPALTKGKSGNDILVVGDDQGNLCIVNTKSGSAFVKHICNQSIKSSPAILKNIVYVGCDDGFLYKISAEIGPGDVFSDIKKINLKGEESEDDFSVDNSLISSPAIGPDGMIFIGSRNGKLYAIDPDDDEVEWNTNGTVPIVASPVIGSNMNVVIEHSMPFHFMPGVDYVIYFINTDGRIYKVDNNGGILGSISIGNHGDVESTPVVVGSLVIVGSDDGVLYGVDFSQSNPKIIWRVSLKESFGMASPLFQNGRIYVALGSGMVYAINLFEGNPVPMPGPNGNGYFWNRFHHDNQNTGVGQTPQH